LEGLTGKPVPSGKRRDGWTGEEKEGEIGKTDKKKNSKKGLQ